MIEKDLVAKMLPGQLLQHYLLASYNYYHLSESPMTDDAFDLLCVRLKGCYDDLTHSHKHLVTKEDLEAGTCLLKAEQFPVFVRQGAEMYHARCANKSIYKDIENYLNKA